MEPPAGYSGPKPHLIEYDIKSDTMTEVVARFMKTGITSEDKVGMFQKDKEDDAITKLAIKAISEQHSLVDA